MERARAVKKQRGLEKELQDTSEKQKVAQSQLRVVSTLFPGVSKMLGLPRVSFKTDMSEHRAQLLTVLAAKPAMRGRELSVAQKTQARAASYVARALVTTQGAFAARALGVPPFGVDDDPLDRDGPDIACISWQWDEATQKCRSLLGKWIPGEQKAAGQISTQVMMQHGSITLYSRSGSMYATISSEPFVCRALFLDRINGESLLEGLLRLHPVPFEDTGKLKEMAMEERVKIFTFSHDRASANYTVLQWIFDQVATTKDIPTLFVHAEPCALHGFQLVRMRPALGKTVMGATYSFTRFLRCWRSSEGWRKEIIKELDRRLSITMDPRGDDVETRHAQILDILFGPDGRHHQRPKSKNTQPNRRSPGCCRTSRSPCHWLLSEKKL